MPQSRSQPGGEADRMQGRAEGQAVKQAVKQAAKQAAKQAVRRAGHNDGERGGPIDEPWGGSDAEPDGDADRMQSRAERVPGQRREFRDSGEEEETAKPAHPESVRSGW